MKKKVCAFALLVVCVLMLSLVSAADPDVSLNQAGTGVQEGISGFSDQTNTVLEKPVEISENFAFVGMLFGVKQGEAVDLRHLIVLICLWFWVFLFIRQALTIAPFFGEGVISWIGGLIVTLLVALSGGLIEVAKLFFNLGSFFGVIRGHSFFQLLLSVVVLMVFFGAMSHIMKKVTREMRKAKAEALGETLKEGAKSAKVFSKGVQDLAKTNRT